MVREVCQSVNAELSRQKDEKIYRQVHHWLSENEGMMAVHVLANKPDYQSETMRLSFYSVSGQLVLRTGGTSQRRDDGTGTLSATSTLVLKPIEMDLGLADQTLTITQQANAATYQFSEIDDVIREEALVHGVAKSYRAFRLVVNEIEFALGCQLESDWEQWLRIL